MAYPETRYHAEVRVTIDGREAKINVFADTLNEIFLDMATICEQLPGPLANGARREILNAELKADQLRKDGKLHDKASKTPARRTQPVCVNCGSTNTELINWNDKVTGEPKQAWKCQDCKQWLPNGKKA
jgi:hypothetical protein